MKKNSKKKREYFVHLLEKKIISKKDKTVKLIDLHKYLINHRVFFFFFKFRSEKDKKNKKTCLKQQKQIYLFSSEQ